MVTLAPSRPDLNAARLEPHFEPLPDDFPGFMEDVDASLAMEKVIDCFRNSCDACEKLVAQHFAVAVLLVAEEHLFTSCGGHRTFTTTYTAAITITEGDTTIGRGDTVESATEDAIRHRLDVHRQQATSVA